MLQPLTRHILLPLHERLRGRGTMDYLRELRRSHAGSADGVQRLQREKLDTLLEHCRTSVPYYSRLLKGLEGTAAATSLAELPVLEREDIRNHLDDLVAPAYRERLIRYNTGGSTGEPLVFYTDAVKEARHNAYKLRCREWLGIRPGDRQVDFWGSPIELDHLSRFRILKDHLLLNHVLLSAFNLTEARLDGYARFLCKFRPRLVYGYPTVIYRVADYIRQTEFRLEGYRPALIACTSEMLFDHQRQSIEDIFRAPVANEYGSRDGGLIAHECAKGTLHIAAEHVYVEVDSPDSEGVGDLLVTNLDGYGMPLVRYRIGDRGRIGGDCSCGLPLPVLASLEGRTNDFVVGAGGRLIHSLAPIYVLRDIRKIRQFKLVQKENLSVELEIAKREDLTDVELSEIRQRLWKVFGFEVPVEFRFVEVIQPERSGKYRWVTSRAASAS